jgi:hypothetical protein
MADPNRHTDAESCVLDAGGNMSLPVMWRLTLGAPHRLDSSDYCDDAASAQACHAAFFGPYSDPGDVLFLFAGMAYLERTAARLGVEQSVQFFMDDFDAFLASRVFNGTIVWPTLTMASPAGAYGGWNSYFTALNAIVPSLMRARGVHVLDYSSFIKGRPADQTWVDAIHPPSQSYQALVLHALGELCAGGGVSDPQSAAGGGR